MTKRQQNRRSFLAAAATLPFACNVFAQNPTGANDTLGFMIMGAGSRGGDHCRAMLANPKTRILYVCDADLKHAENMALAVEKLQGSKPKVIIDMREGLIDKDLDVVSCASVNHWHTLCGIWALQAGKHVFLEKPISSNIHEGKAIVAAAQKYGKICQVGTQRRSHKAMIEAAEFIKSGGIGETKLARGICYKRRKSIGPLGNYPVPKTLDYNIWCGPASDAPLTRPKFHYDWHWQRLWGNGEIGNNGPHFCDLARWMLGIERFPDRVFSYGARIGYDIEKNDPNFVDAGDTPNTHVSLFDYGDKTIVMECRGLESPKLHGVDFGTIFYGTEGIMTANESDCTVYDLTGKEIKRFTGGGGHFKEFIEAVRSNAPSQVKATARCGALSAALCHLGNISYMADEQNKMSCDDIEKKLADYPNSLESVDTFRKTRQHLEENGIDTKKTPLTLSSVLSLDSQKEVFLDNEKANKLMSRNYRAGFVVPSPESV